MKSLFASPLSMICALCVIASATAPVSASPLTFTGAGSISGPGGTVSVGQGGGVTISTATGDSYTLTFPTIVRGGRTHWTAGDLADRHVVVDAATKTTTFTAKIEDGALAAAIPVSFGIALSPEGRARVTLRYDCPEPVGKTLSLCGIFFYTQRAPAVGSQVTVNGVSVPINPDPPQAHTVPITNATAPKDIAFYSNDPYRTVSVHVVQSGEVAARDENITAWQSLGIRLVPVDNQIVLDIDLPSKAKAQSTETYAGIDFYTAEKIHVPQYSVSRNLIQNPSFEEGFQYWNFGNLGTDKGNRFPDSYLIDSTQPGHGKCVKILGEKGESPAYLASFATPIETGKPYTFSFWAKADRKGMAISTCTFPSSFTHGLAWKGVAVSDEWKRYSYSFTAPAAMVSMQFGLSSPVDDCVAWVDDVQLEQGPLTDFTRKPLELVFATDKRDNCIKPGDPIHGRWELSGTAGATGKLTVTVHDALAGVPTSRDASFVIGATGTASVALSWLEKCPRGIYGLEADAKLPDGFAVREYGRLVVTPPADPNVKHHTIFACGGTLVRQGSWDRNLSHLEYYGIGSAMNFDPAPHPHLALMAKHHVTDVTSIFDSGDHFGKIGLKDGWSGNEADLPVIEQAAFDKASAYPEIKYWKLINEPGGKLTANIDEMKRWIVALTAAYKGIKRANPKALVVSIDPANMQPNGGIAMVDNFLNCGGEAICDLIAIHPYRSRPEQPDMDSDMATFLAMLKRHDYKGDVWFTEGGGHLGIHNPTLLLNVHQALSAEDNGGSWRIGNFSYDFGDGERYAAAYAVRQWLVALKYGDRVKQSVDWYYGNGTIDYDNTAEMRAVSLSNLTSQLGNADYVQDVPLSQEARCSLFKDPQNRPVAVVWTHDLKHETEALPGSTLHLAALASKLRIVSMTGSDIATKGGDLTVSPYPVYLIGEPGGAAKLVAAIADGFESSSSGSLVGYAQLKDASHATIALRNTLSKPVTGKLTATSGGQSLASGNVTVAPGQTAEVVAPFTTQTMGIHGSDISISWKANGSTSTLTYPEHLDSLSCPKLAADLPLTGDLGAWKAAGANLFAVPAHMMTYRPYPPNPKYPDAIPWGGPSDLSASFAIGYVPGTLYLGFDVTDDVLAPSEKPEAAWTGDSIQIYFDAWSSGHSLLKQGFDDDDQELDVWPHGDTATVYRTVAPAVQVAFTKRGAVPAIKSVLSKRAGGYVVQLAIPEAELAPLILKAGGVFNLSFIINDSDGEYRKRGLTFTPESTEPFMHPELYPAVVLGR